MRWRACVPSARAAQRRGKRSAPTGIPMRHVRTRILIAATLACAAMPAFATGDDAWHGSLGMDGWLFVLDGTLTVRGHESNINTSFKDTADLIGHANSLFGFNA